MEPAFINRENIAVKKVFPCWNNSGFLIKKNIFLFFLSLLCIKLNAQTPGYDDCSDALKICPGQNYLITNKDATSECNNADGKCDSMEVWRCFYPRNTIWLSFNSNSSGGGFQLKISSVNFEIGPGTMDATVISAISPCQHSTYSKVICISSDSINFQLQGNLLPNKQYWIMLSGPVNNSFNATVNISGPGVNLKFDQEIVLPHELLKDGSIRVKNPTGDLGPYKYALNDSGFVDSAFFKGVGSGTNKVSIKSFNSCVLAKDLFVGTEPLILVTIDQSDVICGISFGKIEIKNISGGSPPYKFSIDNGNYGDNRLFNTLKTGDHLISIKDNRNWEKKFLMKIPGNGKSDCNGGEDMAVFFDGSVKLSPTKPVSDKFYWTPGKYLSDSNSLEPIASPNKTMLYKFVTESPEGCKCEDEVLVTLLEKPGAPHGFTPNGDGINDTWTPYGLNNYNQFTVDVYNRWGQRVFHFNEKNPEEIWDGSALGIDLPEASYFYMITVKHNGELKKTNGVVSILR